jgi:TPR repeat protein
MSTAIERKTHRSSQQFSLISGGQTFQVKKGFLLEKLRLFRDNPSLLNASQYRVRTQAQPEAFAIFLAFLEGRPAEIVSETVGSLRSLAAEFGFVELFQKCDCECLGGFSIVERLLKFEERQCVVEHRLSIAEQEVNRLSGRLSRAESELLSQSRNFESEQLYRRGCECFFGTNGFGERGEELSQVLGFSQLKRSADLGHTDAQYQIGRCLLRGEGCSVNLREGAQYLRQSADGGNSFGENWFGTCLREGSGVEKDDVLGFEFVKRSAAAGNARGQNALGYCFELGHGTAKDLHGAFESYKRSMEQGNSIGQNNYGCRLAEGIGTTADPAAGVAIVKRASDQGLPLAQYRYAVYLEAGKGVVQDVAQAAEYYRRAMEGGYPDAKAQYERCRQ